MKPTELLQEIRIMQFEQANNIWSEGRLTQDDAARILEYAAGAFAVTLIVMREGLLDKRLNQQSSREAPVDGVIALTETYQNKYRGWNANHFYSWYKGDGGRRSYTWGKNKLQEKGLVSKKPKKWKH